MLLQAYWLCCGVRIGNYTSQFYFGFCQRFFHFSNTCLLYTSSETYFYAAICLLKGQKAFLTQRPIIDKIEEYLNAAIMIEPKGIYYFFWAYIKRDYYERKFFKTAPNSKELMKSALDAGLSQEDVKQLTEILGVGKLFANN